MLGASVPRWSCCFSWCCPSSFASWWTSWCGWDWLTSVSAPLSLSPHHHHTQHTHTGSNRSICHPAFTIRPPLSGHFADMQKLCQCKKGVGQIHALSQFDLHPDFNWIIATTMTLVNTQLEKDILYWIQVWSSLHVLVNVKIWVTEVTMTKMLTQLMVLIFNGYCCCYC